MLSPKEEEEIPTHNRAEKGKKRIEEQESSASKLLSLITEMREDMKRKDKHINE